MTSCGSVRGRLSGGRFLLSESSERSNSMARPEKEAVVSELTHRLSSSEAALLTEYRGLTVTQMAEVRSALRAAGADLKVYKNTLARIAVKEAGYDGLEGDLQGPTAIAFCHGDPSAAAKALDDSIKKFPVLVLKGGVLSGRVVRADQAQELAKLEPREVQLAKIVMMVNSPLQQTAKVFSALLRDFGSMLAQVIAQKESGGDSAAA
jgi:large subunit ribosomal protein L10